MAAPKGGTPNALVNVLMEGNDRQIVHMLMQLDRSLSGPSLMAWMATHVDPWIRGRAKARFKQEGDDVSGPWAPLKPATQNIRQNHPQGPFGGAHPINKRTGKLEAYITGAPPQIVSHSLGATYTFPGRAPFGELKDKVLTAQTGRAVPNTVARPVMGVNEKDLLAVLTDLSLHLAVGQFR